MIGPRLLWLIFLASASVCCSQEHRSSAGPVSSGADLTGVYSLSKLQLQSDPSTVLVRIDGDVALTVGEFNERLMEFLIADSGQSAAMARKEVLDQMINAKLIVREARRRRRAETASLSLDGKPYQEERALASSVIKADVANPLLVTDEEAGQFLKQNPTIFAGAQGETLAPEVKLLHIKFTMLSARFQEKIGTWRDEVTLEVSEELLEPRDESGKGVVQ